MKVSHWIERRELGRSLLAGAVVFGVLFPYQLYVVPLFPALDAQVFDVLAAATAAGCAWWFAFRVWRR